MFHIVRPQHTSLRCFRILRSYCVPAPFLQYPSVRASQKNSRIVSVSQSFSSTPLLRFAMAQTRSMTNGDNPFGHSRNSSYPDSEGNHSKKLIVCCDGKDVNQENWYHD